MQKATNGRLIKKDNKRSFWASIRNHKLLYLFLIPGVIWFIIFAYVPMYGVLIAFQKHDLVKGIWGSEWVGLANFKKFFAMPAFPRLMINTVRISLLKILFGFPAPIILALLLNEVKNQKFKRVTQTISYLPYFISWVVVAGIWKDLFSINEGSLINSLLLNAGIVDAPINFFGDTRYVLSMVVASDIWKSVGFGTILYLAAMTAVNPEIYEAATMDGAGRFRRMWHVTLPAVKPTILMLFILGMGGILNAGFDQMWVMHNPQVAQVTEIIDIFVTNMGIFKAQYELTTAIGLFKSVVGLILIFVTNFIVKVTGEEGLL